MNALEIADLARTLTTFITQHVDPHDPLHAMYETVRADMIQEMHRVIGTPHE
jgi:hypothetical protein